MFLEYLVRLRSVTLVHIGQGTRAVEMQIRSVQEGLELLDKLLAGEKIRVTTYSPTVKHPDGSPYLPGTSIKGSLETLLINAGESTLGKEMFPFPIFSGLKIFRKSRKCSPKFHLNTSAPRLIVPDVELEDYELELIEVRRLGARRQQRLRLEAIEFKDVEFPIYVDLKRLRKRAKEMLDERYVSKKQGLLRFTPDAAKIFLRTYEESAKRLDKYLKLGARKVYLRFLTSVRGRVEVPNLLDRFFPLGFGTLCSTKTVSDSFLERRFGKDAVRRVIGEIPNLRCACDRRTGKFMRPKTLRAYKEGSVRRPLGICEFEISGPKEISSYQDLLHGAGKGL